MTFQINYTVINRDRNHSWFLRQMCKELKDYLLSLSFDESYDNVLYHIGDIKNGETTEILAQEFPFLQVRCIDYWPDLKHEEEFNERTKFYNNIIKWKGSYEQYKNKILPPAMIYLDYCNEEHCILNHLKFWLPRMNYGSVLSGYNLSYKQHENPKKLFQIKKSIIRGIGEFPHKVYLDGSWYRIL